MPTIEEVDENEEGQVSSPGIVSKLSGFFSRQFDNLYEWTTIGFGALGSVLWVVGSAYFLFVIPMLKGAEVERGPSHNYPRLHSSRVDSEVD